MDSGDIDDARHSKELASEVAYLVNVGALKDAAEEIDEAKREAAIVALRPFAELPGVAAAITELEDDTCSRQVRALYESESTEGGKPS